jgi:hypothetical protein
MINDVTLVTQDETKERNQLQVSKPSLNKEALIITLPVEKRLPAPQKEFPVTKWTMPPEQHGYIQGHDNDCL